MTTDPKTIERLRELEKKATPAPWESPLHDIGDRYFDHTYEAYPPLGESGPVVVTGCPRNMEMMVELRNHAASLLSDASRVQELEAESDRAADLHAKSIESLMLDGYGGVFPYTKVRK